MGASPEYWCGAADLNGDGVIGATDILKLGECWQQTLPAGPSAGFLGFSASTLDGGRGQLSMNGACVDTFGAGAFMCPTTAFAMQPVPVALAGTGWVQAVLAPSGVTDFGVIEVVTGSIVNSASLACFGWTSSSSNVSGLAVSVLDPSGIVGGPSSPFNGFVALQCSAPRPVACCRLP